MKRFIMFVICSLMINSMSLVKVFGMKALAKCFSCCVRIEKPAPVAHAPTSIREQLKGVMRSPFHVMATQNIVHTLEEYGKAGDDICDVVEHFNQDTKQTMLHHIVSNRHGDVWVAESRTFQNSNTERLKKILTVYQNAGGNVARLIEMQDEEKQTVLQRVLSNPNRGRYQSGMILALLTAGGRIDTFLLNRTVTVLPVDCYEHWLTILETIIAYASCGGDVTRLISCYSFEQIGPSNFLGRTPCNYQDINRLIDLLLVPGVDYSFLVQLSPILFPKNNIFFVGPCYCLKAAIDGANTRRPALNAKIDADNAAIKRSIQEQMHKAGVLGIPALDELCAQYSLKPLIQEFPAELLALVR